MRPVVIRRPDPEMAGLDNLVADGQPPLPLCAQLSTCGRRADRASLAAPHSLVSVSKTSGDS